LKHALDECYSPMQGLLNQRDQLEKAGREAKLFGF
jgi:hypothetical protein